MISLPYYIFTTIHKKKTRFIGLYFNFNLTCIYKCIIITIIMVSRIKIHTENLENYTTKIFSARQNR